MDIPEPKWLTYQAARNLVPRIRAAEVPVEHAISLPIPTRRWGVPGFAHFAAPALRDPEGPTRQSPPDRWWVIDARRSRLIVYALVSAVPFAPGVTFEACELHSAQHTLDELRQAHADLEQALDAVLVDFFLGQPGTAVARRLAAERLAKVVAEPLLPIYRALAPDFYAWLDL